MKPIVVVGSINTDLVVTTANLPLKGETIPGRTFDTYQGGKGANQAVAAARLGATVHMVGMVGSDAFGAESVRLLEAQGVDCQHVATVPGPSGVAIITVAERGHNTIVVVPGANGHVSPEFIESKRQTIRAAGMVLAQLEIPLESVLALAQLCAEEGVPLMLDPAPAQTLPRVLLSTVTWFTPNETEADFYAGQSPQTPAGMVDALRAQGVHNIVLKLGERGAALAVEGSEIVAVTPVTVEAVDTTAAGDTFNGAFAAALCQGSDLPTAGAFAASAAALSVTKPGAQASMPDLREVRHFQSKQSNLEG